MAAIERRNFSTILLQIALGLMFIVGGIWIFMGNQSNEVVVSINSIFKGSLATALIYAFAVIELIAGVFLILRIFLNLGTKFDSVLILIIMICWIVAIILLDFLGPKGLIKSLNGNLLGFLSRFANHLLILGAIIKVKY